MSDINHFVSQPAEWLRSGGPENDVVISSRIRLARNLEKYPFLPQLKNEEKKEIVSEIEDVVKESHLLRGALFFNCHDLNEIDLQFLVERHLISREHAMETEYRAAAISPNEVVSLMILEEDHLRLQAFHKGFNLLEAWRIINQLDSELEGHLKYAFSPNLGYLTACPTNVGTGIRASCMLHLPSLVITKQVHKVLQALAKLNLAARGLYGEGTQATGNFFQFSNQMTLGQNEEEIIDNLDSVIRQVIEHEKEARAHLREKKKAKFEDQIWRACGTLKSARVISSQEATQLLSLIQLGIHTGIIEADIEQENFNLLFLLIQPAHLQKIAGKMLDASERDIERAKLIRQHLMKIKI